MLPAYSPWQRRCPQPVFSGVEMGFPGNRRGQLQPDRISGGA
jgi:hypothetical protein